MFGANVTGRTTARWAAAGCWLAVCAGLASTAGALTPEQELELKMFTGQLADPARSAKTKAEAAELLLTRSYPEAVGALAKFLSDSSNAAAQVAVAEAVARQGTETKETKEFIEPLLAMLTGAEPAVRTAAARALVTYKNHGVTERLIALATDRKADKAVRLVTITGLQRVLDKQAVDALVSLVGERDTVIRNAAAEALANLTSIRAFGADPSKWRRWWLRNKNRPATEWLADLAESLAREAARLEEENLQLRRRLAAAMAARYDGTAAAGQEELLLEFLRDSLADVRLVGVNLADKKAAVGGALGQELRKQVRAMLADEAPQVRRAVALLTANVSDPNATDALLGRLKVEETPEAKQGVLTALGQLGDAKAFGPILDEVLSQDDPTAAAAAAALARGAAAQPIPEPMRPKAVATLLQRHGTATAATNGDAASLREALLTAMGTVADEQFIPALREGLNDPAATVRLAAVTGLAQLRRADLADAVVLLAADADRGVRQAVIDALGSLGADSHLQTLLQRTDPAAEADAAVREKAWSVAMAVLAKADAKTLAEVSESLADRADAVGRRIELQQMLIKILKADKSPDLPQAQRKLAASLMGASRPAEAAPLLGEAYSQHAAAKSPQAREVYLEWIDALLAANDPVVVKALGDPDRADTFGEAVGRLTKRLTSLVGEQRYAPVVLLAAEVLRQLPTRLSPQQRTALEQVAADAAAKQLAEDRKRVTQLATQLMATDASAAEAAAGELRTLGERAVKPLVLELKKLASGEKSSPEAEKALLDVLVQIAPKLVGYDIQSPKDDRLARIENWLKSL